MKITLKRAALLLLIVLLFWRGRFFLQRQYRGISDICITRLSEVLVKANLEHSPRAHAYLSSFAQLDRYQAADRSLPSNTNGRIVFYGDSIIDFWPTYYPQQFFSGPQYIGRGVSGQSTPQMVWRLRQDVLDLHPSTLVLLAGTNDVIQTKLHLTLGETETNIQTMVDLASQHHIRVILCSVLPVARFPPAQQAAFTREIKSLNQWLRSYAAKKHLPYVDFYDAMANASGAMQDSLSNDGTHPNVAGYNIMRSLVQPLVQQAIAPTTPVAAVPSIAH